MALAIFICAIIYLSAIGLMLWKVDAFTPPNFFDK